jgi:hypothetical protein
MSPLLNDKGPLQLEPHNAAAGRVIRMRHSNGQMALNPGVKVFRDLIWLLTLTESSCFWQLKPPIIREYFKRQVPRRRDEASAGFTEHISFLTASNFDSERNDEDKGHRRRHWLHVQSGADTDCLPTRARSHQQHTHQYSKYAMQDWGIQQLHHPIPEFPSTINSVADAAFEAITGCLAGRQRLDPNLASNAMARNSIFDYRPVKNALDSGRLGIEIDGANMLRMDTKNQHSQGTAAVFEHATASSALRRLVLVLAGKLSVNLTVPSNSESSTCPVAIYFTTVKQALAASQDLHFLKQQSFNAHYQQVSYQNVTILCLGQDDGIPLYMMNNANNSSTIEHLTVDRKRGSKRTHKDQSNFRGAVNASRGVVIVVQPTDFNQVDRPPGPAIGAITSLQRLVARASLEELPVVMVSPRFLVQDVGFGAGSGPGWDQSVGSQQAATYGGLEPPNGPTPWILRDFNPPSYCFVGNAVDLTSHGRLRASHDPSHVDPNVRQYGYCQIALTQTVMEEGHPWHVFAARQEKDSAGRIGRGHFVYDYLASTKPSSGRPTRDILQRILSEFGAASGS